MLSPSDYTRLTVLKIISLESCSLIKLYDSRRCRNPHVSWIQRLPEKIQYWGKNTTWQWWLHQRVLRITFHTELWVQRVCLHLPIKHGLACIFNHVEQSTVYESDRKVEQLQWWSLLNMEQIMLVGENNCRLTFQKLMLVHLSLIHLFVLKKKCF